MTFPHDRSTTTGTTTDTDTDTRAPDVLTVVHDDVLSVTTDDGTTTTTGGASAAPAVRDLSVVVTHYKSPEDLLRCIDSLLAGGGERLAKVVVADSEAQPGLRERLAHYPSQVVYVPMTKNVGFGALVNEGLGRTGTPYVLVLNADVRIAPGCLDELAAHLDANPGCAVAAPRLRNDDGSLQQSVYRFHKPTTVVHRRTPLGRTATGRRELERFLDRSRLEGSAASLTPIPVDWVLGAAMCVRRTAVEQVGEMDAAYFLYFEDVDWCRRFWAKGWSVDYVPAAFCHHTHARASAQGGVFAALRNHLTRRHIRSALRYFAKHGPRAERPAPRVPAAATAPAPAPAS